MYKCKNCKSMFETPGTYRESSGEKWNICPLCESTEISELQPPKEIEPLEALEMLVYLCASYNVRNTNNEALEYAMDRVRKFISETVNDDDLYSDLKVCKSVGTVQTVIEYIYKIYEEKE